MTKDPSPNQASIHPRMGRHLLSEDDPLLKHVPSLKRALLPAVENHSSTQASSDQDHALRALLACFEALCVLDQNTLKPRLTLVFGTFEEGVDNIAKSCGYSVRNFNIHNLTPHKDGWPALVFLEENSQPHLIFYKNTKPYLYDPVTKHTRRLSKRILLNCQPLGFLIYPQLQSTTQTIGSLGKETLHVGKSEIKRYLFLQALIAFLALLLPLLSGMIFDDVLKLRQIDVLHQIFLGMLTITLASTGFRFLQNYTMMRLQIHLSRHIQSGLWQRVMAFHLSVFRLFRLGDFHERASSIDGMQRQITTTTMNGLCQGFFILIPLSLVAFHIPALGGILLGTSFIFVVILFFLLRQIVRHQRSVIATEAHLLSFLFETIRSIIKVKTTGAHKRIFTRWLNMEFTKLRPFLREQYLVIYQHLLQFAFPPLMTVALYILVTHMNSNPMDKTILMKSMNSSSFTLGNFISVQFAMGQFFAAFMGMIGVLDDILKLFPTVERIRPLLSQKTELPTQHDTNTLLSPILKGEIALHNVSFHYHAHFQDRPILSHLNLHLRPKEYVAIVGPSGAGKSTLLKLLLGFDTPTQGEITFDGLSLSSLNMQEVRRQMGVVMQQSSILPGSIIENLRAVNPTLTEDVMWQLLDAVALKDDVESMPMGLHTLILGDGRTFSMGQRQRLCLARCLAKNHSILLLDEPTSALDNQRQKIVLNTLRHYPATRIMVAHRLSTLQDVDRILVMNQGKIVEDGSFESLLAQRGEFYALVHGKSL